VFPVISNPAKYDPKTQVAERIGCEYVVENQRWETAWAVRDKTAEELQAEYDAEASRIRHERNRLIAECDWTQLDDTPLTNAKKLEWAEYRQALRDIPTQSGFPWDVVWPNKP
jgi:hypothetical protein